MMVTVTNPSLDSCKFCCIANGTIVSETHDQAFLRSPKYFAIASIGALVEGWSLVCPKEHTPNLRNNYADKEFRLFLRRVYRRVFANYGTAALFEHGANCSSSVTGCGINHAHLHIVPLATSLKHYMQETGLDWHKVRSSEVREITSEKEYLFYSDDIESPDPAGLVHILRTPSSQFFRRLVARSLDREAEFDYKTHPHVEAARQTCLALSDDGGERAVAAP